MTAYHSKRGPVEGCPQEDEPIRERAWADGQKLDTKEQAMTNKSFTAEEVREYADRVDGDSDKAFSLQRCAKLLYAYADMLAAQPAGIPDGWSGWCTQMPGRLPKLWGARDIAELNYHPEYGWRLFKVVEVAATPSAPEGDGGAK